MGWDCTGYKSFYYIPMTRQISCVIGHWDDWWPTAFLSWLLIGFGCTLGGQPGEVHGWDRAVQGPGRHTDVCFRPCPG